MFWKTAVLEKQDYFFPFSIQEGNSGPIKELLDFHLLAENLMHALKIWKDLVQNLVSSSLSAWVEEGVWDEGGEPNVNHNEGSRPDTETSRIILRHHLHAGTTADV